MDVNALLKKYEEELHYQSQVNENISAQTASALMRMAVKEVAANAGEGWREATRQVEIAADAELKCSDIGGTIRQLEDELARVRQSWQNDASALALALLNVEKLEEESLELRATLAMRDSYIAGLSSSSLVNLLEAENKQLRQAVDDALALQRLYHQRWLDIREWARKRRGRAGVGRSAHGDCGERYLPSYRSGDAPCRLHRGAPVE